MSFLDEEWQRRRQPTPRDELAVTMRESLVDTTAQKLWGRGWEREYAKICNAYGVEVKS